MVISNFKPCDSDLFTHISLFIIQISLAASFLVLFYFFYVVKVENAEFNKQIDFIVDDFISDAKNKGLINDGNITDQDKGTLDGLLYIAKQKASTDFQSQISQIQQTNTKLKNKYTMITGIIIGIIIIFILILYFFLSCRQSLDMVKESIIILAFVALTEYIFLNFISKKYIAADPNKIKGILGQSIKQWLQQNEKI